MVIVDKRQCCFKKLIWSDVNLERGGNMICQNKSLSKFLGMESIEIPASQRNAIQFLL